MRLGGLAEPAHYNESEIGMSDTKEQAETTAQSKAWDPFQLMDRMDEEALRELPKIEKRTGYLAMLGNLATLAGLLGTITGLIKSFAGVAGVDPSMKATMLSKGISEAMNCTAFGLSTGIIGLAAFAWLNGKTQVAIDDIAEVKKNVSNLLYQAKAAMQG